MESKHCGRLSLKSPGRVHVATPTMLPLKTASVTLAIGAGVEGGVEEGDKGLTATQGMHRVRLSRSKGMTATPVIQMLQHSAAAQMAS